ncbi:ABC transporter substrate-binding protein [Mycetocola zhujimingii]|uniref:ABC transporter substrate-binding protein n=1 Tax=Mycetocola zhujimingii TaxID=2079792 RepID=UPI000D35B80C|nr:ABC transporter substrate-binding protein [Mycetocola zhujimingii]AWB87659.1 twin-arginine translocation pathway signal protein [Mycetocola zhujimingii]
MFRSSRNVAWVGSLAVITLALTGCSASGSSEGEGGGKAPAELTPVTFQMNWTAGGANAGFAAAVSEGIYEEYGLDVTLVEGNGSGNTAQLVSSGQADIAYADAVAVSQLIAQGAPMKVLSTIYQSNPNEVEALKETGVDSLEDLKGLKVGVPSGSSQTTMLPLFLKANGLSESDVNLVNMPNTSMVPALLQGEVDAILGSIDSYRIQLEAQGAELDTFTFADNGVPTVSTSIFASNDYMEENPDIVKAFIAASLEGWDVALDEPETAVAALKEIFSTVDTDLATQELENITPLFCSGDAVVVGRAEAAQWELTQEMLSEVELLPAGTDPTTYYTNEYLPDESDMRSC